MNQTHAEKRVYEVLESLGVSFIRHEHPPVYTVEEARLHWKNLKGAHCKNLFLRNKKGNRHYLVILEHSKNADLKKLKDKLGEDRLSFGSTERLQRFLGLEPGAVSPFGLIFDTRKEVMVVIDQELRQAERVHFHPNVNTVTLGLSFLDFERFLAWAGNTVRYLAL
jgi:Ala-tRNA(Pro) deacylase